MFRNMRRIKQQLSKDECESILLNASSGVLALCGDDGYPYAVPLSFVYDNGALYFHCAKSGHKIDAIKNCDKASFCVTAEDNISPENYTTFFKSVIVFGKIGIVTDVDGIRYAIEKLALKYNPDDTYENRQNAVNKDFRNLCILRLNVEHITGKQAIELVKKAVD